MFGKNASLAKKVKYSSTFAEVVYIDSLTTRLAEIKHYSKLGLLKQIPTADYILAAILNNISMLSAGHH